jgi:adenylosuccinate synthase
LLDELNEKRLDKDKIGTTKKGIGPAYADKTNRFGIRVCDLFEADLLKSKININVDYINLLLTKIYDMAPLDADEIYSTLLEYAAKIKPYVCDVSIEIDKLIKQGKNIVLEGAQGAMLDIDFGTYPYVTSSHPTSGGVAIGVGISPKSIDYILGIVKAYTTRVGEGPFPTELNDETGEFLRQNGHEFGTTTGRPRRCGWFDAAVVKYSARLNGLTHIALTKLDTLTGIDKIKVCTHYELDGQKIEYYPASLATLARCKACYEELDGWNEDISKAESFEQLPVNAQNYVKFLEKQTGVQISIVSVGAERNNTIILDSII